MHDGAVNFIHGFSCGDCVLQRPGNELAALTKKCLGGAHSPRGNLNGPPGTEREVAETPEPGWAVTPGGGVFSALPCHLHRWKVNTKPCPMAMAASRVELEHSFPLGSWNRSFPLLWLNQIWGLSSPGLTPFICWVGAWNSRLTRPCSPFMNLLRALWGQHVVINRVHDALGAAHTERKRQALSKSAQSTRGLAELTSCSVITQSHH